MTRKKVKLAFITNDSARKATFKKRKKGLMKKVSEISTLCGIDSCAIIYSPYQTQPEVWPNTLGAQRVLSQFRRMPEMEQSKKMVNQESFIRQRISKANEQLKKQHKENREKEMTALMYKCLTGNKGLQNLTTGDLNDLGWLIDQNLKEVNERIESLKKTCPAQHANNAQGLTYSDNKTKVSGSAATVSGEMLAHGGGGVHCHEQKPVVDLSMDALQRPQCFTDWMNNPSEHTGFGHGGEVVTMPSNDNNHNSAAAAAAMWSAAFFP